MIRTRNLLTWNQTRYRCATKPTYKSNILFFTKFPDCLHSNDDFEIADYSFSVLNSNQSIPISIQSDRENFCITVNDDSFVAFVAENEWMLAISLNESSDFINRKILSPSAVPLMFYFSKSHEFIYLTPMDNEECVSLNEMFFGPLKIGYQLNVNPHFYPMIYHQIRRSEPCSLEGFTFNFSPKPNDNYNAIKFVENSLKKRKGRRVEIKYFVKQNGSRPSEEQLQEITQILKLQIEDFYDSIKLPTLIEIEDSCLKENSLLGTVFLNYYKDKSITCDMKISILKPDQQDWSF